MNINKIGYSFGYTNFILIVLTRGFLLFLILYVSISNFFIIDCYGETNITKVKPPVIAKGVKVFSLRRPWYPKIDNKSFYNPPELKYPEIYGISWRFRWKHIEPKEGHYNWHIIDKAIESTAKAGKRVMLRVIAGQHTPKWVYKAGAEPFTFSNKDLYHSKLHKPNMMMPVPWNDVYLIKWENFIKAFGKRYNGRPEVYSIQMTGGGRIGEMNLPKAMKKWKQAGYTSKNLTDAWKQIIDTYQKAFPDTATNLDINRPLGRNSDDVLYAVISYVLNTYPEKVYLQQNGLKANLPENYHIRKLLRRSSKKTKIGYQMVGGKNWINSAVGNRRTAFLHAKEDNASYIEVYASDIRDIKIKESLKVLY